MSNILTLNIKHVVGKKKQKRFLSVRYRTMLFFFFWKISLISDTKQMTHETSPTTKLITSVPIWPACAPLPRDSHLFCGAQIKGNLQSARSFCRAIMNDNFRN